jgi:hypothetical protein
VGGGTEWPTVARADWSAIFDAVGLPQTKTSSAVPSAPSAILSAVGQLQREALEEVEGRTQLPAHREGYSAAGARINDVAVLSEDVHNVDEAADAILLHNFNPYQPRDKYGEWTKIGSSAAPSKARGAEGMLAEAKGSSAAGKPGATFDLKKVQEYVLNPVNSRSLQAATDKIWKSLGTLDPVASPIEDNKPNDVFVRFRGSSTFPTAEDMKNKYDAISGFAWVLDIHLKPVKYDSTTRRATFDTSGTTYHWQPWIMSSANMGNPAPMYAVGDHRPVPLAAFSQTIREHELWHHNGTKGEQYDDLRQQAARAGWDLPPHPGFAGELNRRIQQVKNKLGNGQITVQLTPAQANLPDAQGRSGKGPYNPRVARFIATKKAGDDAGAIFAPLTSEKAQDAISDAGEFHEERTPMGRGSYIKWIGAKSK